METLLILSAFVFLLFGWFIRWALRFTQETVGEDAPLQRTRTYRFSAVHYFGGFTKILIAFLLPEMVVLTWIMVKEAIKQQNVLIILFALFFGAFAGLVCFYFYFDWRYWQITRDISVTFNPEQKTLEVDGPHQSYIFSAEDVVLIEEHVKKTSNSKDIFGGYGYFLFYLSDDTVVQINNIFISHLGHFEFMQRHFSDVPKAIIEHRLPWPAIPG